MQYLVETGQTEILISELILIKNCYVLWKDFVQLLRDDPTNFYVFDAANVLPRICVPVSFEFDLLEALVKFVCIGIRDLSFDTDIGRVVHDRQPHGNVGNERAP